MLFILLLFIDEGVLAVFNIFCEAIKILSQYFGLYFCNKVFMILNSRSQDANRPGNIKPNKVILRRFKNNIPVIFLQG